MGLQKSGTTDKFTFYYQNKDHLGTVRETVTSTGAMKQRVNYYPFGGQLVDTLKAMVLNRDAQPYKYNGKEFDGTFGLNTYDYGARQHYPILARWDRIDPLCEKYYGVSPYAYCGNNPVDRIDPDGLDWFIDVDGTYQYSPDVHSQDDLKKGQTYLWEERKVWNDNKNKKKECTYYRKDGSILYDNETAAYNRMWNQADRHYRQYNKGGREVGGFILSNGKVLVMPDYKNDATSSYISDYGYKLNKDGILSHGDESFEVLANIHTHQERTTDPSPSVNSRESDLGISKCMGGLPVITMGHDNKVYGIFHIKGGKGWRYSSFDLHSRTGLLKGSYTIYPWLKKTFKR
ncbi:MAG: RHS repeat-associated core domain-containing protein [Prevotella sp.]|nr:RHS repeat-associated core domain-containing protein [Prevotella sp.]